MNIHEYQGKSILQSFGVAIQRGKVADTPEAAHDAAVALAEETGTEWFVVKAQIHAGGRGKGTVTETGSHGVVLAKGLDHVKDKAQGILGGHLVTGHVDGVGLMKTPSPPPDQVQVHFCAEPRTWHGPHQLAVKFVTSRSPVVDNLS